MSCMEVEMLVDALIVAGAVITLWLIVMALGEIRGNIMKIHRGLDDRE